MHLENRILIFSGLSLTAMTMFFGFYYAVFDEHQTLVGMGVAMMNGFVEAAGGDRVAAYAALQQYGEIAAEYKREIHFHGHSGFLGLVLILYGLVVHKLGYGRRARVGVASGLATSAAVFPLGVLLQIGPLASLGKVLAVLGTIGLVLAMFVIVIGVSRGQEPRHVA
jgi:hypothetical protein